MDEVQATAAPPPRVRRRHSPGFRSEVINAAKQPGTSFSAVARSYSLSPSLVRRWVRESESRRRRSEHASAARLTAQRPHAGERVVAAMAGMKVGTPAPAGFVPLGMKPPASDIRIEVTRGSTSVAVAWPVSAAEHCAAWLCELLR